ncbi:hypothetical protein HDU76_014025 [Blyttiomyces sp. JEL0837]|nr:hypothetical protein HDU76_014025 [Blyttiomyces sp. JEL0837]
MEHENPPPFNPTGSDPTSDAPRYSTVEPSLAFPLGAGSGNSVNTAPANPETSTGNEVTIDQEKAKSISPQSTVKKKRSTSFITPGEARSGPIDSTSKWVAALPPVPPLPNGSMSRSQSRMREEPIMTSRNVPREYKFNSARALPKDAKGTSTPVLPANFVVDVKSSAAVGGASSIKTLPRIFSGLDRAESRLSQATQEPRASRAATVVSDDSSDDFVNDIDLFGEEDDEDDDEKRSVAHSASTGTSGSEIRRVHPFVKWVLDSWNSFLGMKGTRFMLRILAQQRTVILFWLGVLMFVHAAVSTMLILSLTVIMPGIWVYNAMQLFVMVCAILSNVSGSRLSHEICTSMAASDLVRGVMRMPALKDYWTHGPNSPAYSVYRASTSIALLAEAMIAACIVLFQWQDVPTFIKKGQCTPATYEGAFLPTQIDLSEYMLGDIDMETLQNYGLGLADGVIGGWAGWPNEIPGRKYQITGSGPIYLTTALCDNGNPGPNIPMPDYGVIFTGQTLGSDSISFQTSLSIMYPPGTLINDVTGELNTGTYIQKCLIETYVGFGDIKVGFSADQYGTITSGKIVEVHAYKPTKTAIYPSQIEQHVNDFKPSFVIAGNDTYLVKPLIEQAVQQIVNNQTYYPSQGSVTSNILWWQTGDDGYYHSALLERSLSSLFAGLAHYACMQFNGNETVPCSYYGPNGHGILLIPEVAVIGAAIGSAVAIFVKLFEIMWWAFTTVKETTPGYHKAIRALTHPVRFALDTAEILTEFINDPESEYDPCDSQLKLIVERFGNGRLMYGEDIQTLEEERGHLRIGRYGKVRKMDKDRTYGSGMQPLNPELEELLDK